jgi:hypothetical protein
MIAKNYRQFAAAAALQGVLAFGRPLWALSRPSTRALRAVRASRAKLIASREQLVTWCKAVTPQWMKDSMKKAKAMADAWKAAQMQLPFLDETPKKKELTLAEMKQQAKKNASDAKHSGLEPAFIKLKLAYSLYECWRDQVFGGYRQMYGFETSKNRCPKTQQYKAEN